MRIDLNTPFSEKDEAKSLGAKWDASRRVWYILDVEELTPFLRWIPERKINRSFVSSKTEIQSKQFVSLDSAKIALRENSYPLRSCSCNVLPWEDCPHTAD